MSEGNPKGFFSAQGGERQGEIGMILPADAPALARPACRLGFPSHCRWRRRAAPRSHPFPRLTLVLCVQVVTQRLGSVRPALGSLDMRPQRQPAAAGMQARTPTCLLDPSLTMLIPPPWRPSVANSPALRDPRPPRAFPVPRRHAGVGTTLRTPLPVAQMGDLCSALGALCTAQTSTTGGLRRTSPATQSIIMSR